MFQQIVANNRGTANTYTCIVYCESDLLFDLFKIHKYTATVDFWGF